MCHIGTCNMHLPHFTWGVLICRVSFVFFTTFLLAEEMNTASCRLIFTFMSEYSIPGNHNYAYWPQLKESPPANISPQPSPPGHLLLEHLILDKSPIPKMLMVWGWGGGLPPHGGGGLVQGGDVRCVCVGGNVLEPLATKEDPPTLVITQQLL